MLLLDKVRTATLLFVTITNNLFMRVLLPGGKLFSYCCLREVPAVILEERREQQDFSFFS